MITTVTLNPCIDKLVTIDKFIYGGLNRIQSSRQDPAGKGINVAVAYRQIGGREVLCTGVNYTKNGYLIENLLKNLNIPYDFVDVEGKVRTNLKFFDSSTGEITEINESGYRVPSDVVIKLREKIRLFAEKSEIVVLSGSVPKGITSTIYRELLVQLNGLPVKTILDAEGELLLNGLEAVPYMIKPNIYELESALGKKLNTHEEIALAGKTFIEKGISFVLISMGGEGAIIVDKHNAFFAPAVPVEVKGTAGAGDSMVAAACLALNKKLNTSDMLKYCVAAATASVSKQGTLLCTRGELNEVLPKVRIYPIDI